MITEIILMIFAIAYYLFSVFLFATIIQDVDKTYTIAQVVGMSVITVVVSPIAVPIILGIEIGECIKDN